MWIHRPVLNRTLHLRHFIQSAATTLLQDPEAPLINLEDLPNQTQTCRDHPRNPTRHLRKDHLRQGAQGRPRPQHRVRAGGRPARRQQAPHLRPDQPDPADRHRPWPLLLPLQALRPRGPARIRVRRRHREGSTVAATASSACGYRCTTKCDLHKSSITCFVKLMFLSC
ncbi:50S ribosomal protein [Actinidia chinensis var. chinensis]|uniref:50S ribosomal protein n=1 Tax=Actinidia chinensis var. chinensis TaxID=1590841 RepID=A0A2R6Q8I4_ACTCC|nr:50S ribosomal protein [Actinidia chinensis var. chinensis]